MKKFALMGAAGFIAVRHFKAIKETKNELVAALDKHDNVGILDNFFPESDFFLEFERFDRHLDKLRRNEQKIDFVSICTPNYLHDSHIRFALRQNADAICEKPLVLNPWNLDALQEIETETGKKINTILQLRLHPTIISLKNKISLSEQKNFQIDLTYITSRGKWYFSSWKADISKSGGITTNIGVHFFDMLIWIFGKVQKNIVHLLKPNKAAGILFLEKATVRWFLSIDFNDIPDSEKILGKRTFRSIKIENEEIEFSDGFVDLHTLSYEKILQNEGFGIKEARESIEIIHQIRNSEPTSLVDDYHPFLKTIF